MPDLSEWARDYGAALCLPADRARLPWDQLTPAEQQCVTRVGEGAEHKLLSHFAGPLPTPELYRYAVQGPTGQQLGTLTYADGTLSLCWTPPHAPQACQVIGAGHDGLLSVIQLLGLQGFHLRDLPPGA